MILEGVETEMENLLKERKPLEYYLRLKYPVTIHEAEEGGYFAEIIDLPGCMAQAETLDHMHKEIDIARKLWLESMYEDGNEIPLPRNENEYSGKFIIRVPKSLHRKLDQIAELEGVSLNQYVVSALSHVTGQNNPTTPRRGRYVRTSQK